MQISLSYIHILLVVWFLALYYGERIYPRSAISACRWPKDKDWPSDVHPARIALVADPQLIDDHTYPSRNWIFQRISEFIVDVYLRRNWVYINSVLDPDANIFLGDLFDGGREWSDNVWYKEYERWNRIFTKPPYKRTIMSLPGNHDIGYGNTIVYHALERFSMYFGEPSSTVDIGNHTLVLLDTISMLNTENKTVYSKPYDFLNRIINTPDFYNQSPRILLSHVPLFRDPKHPCGRHRESKKPLPYVKGYQYQTMASPELSQTILNALRPAAVFSGDDHDACYVVHNYTISSSNDGTSLENQPTASASEYTAKSISMAMGIGHPGIQLLTLYHDTSDPKYNPQTPSYATRICLMPNPFRAFVLYISLIGLTVSLSVLINFLPEIFPSTVHAILTRRRPLYSSVPYSPDSSPESSPTLHPVSGGLLPSYASEITKQSTARAATTTATSRLSSSSSSPSASPEVPVRKTVTFALDESHNSRNANFTALWRRMRRKMAQRSSWKVVGKELAYIAIPTFLYFFFLSRSIYNE
ncbi:uncharacterized protein SAPINGB_P001794 [Magnusiomyces paraingens]|uniref:Calcineurin-like phosphoesterase domain-containing protein n=1 Tax=Magnusiomyces paraingens TaxID=2606893 RepID=A0A5E8BB94_9ASCO|nr:uncharacterized protein SAPINGB_P001794 [Saprochaete ingens]VVT48468.1 unnamed protein product [Saprochaete ingens]